MRLGELYDRQGFQCRDVGRDLILQEVLDSGFHRRFAPLPQPNDLIEDALSHFPFRGLGDFDNLIVGDDGDFVAIGIEADAFAGNVVDHDRVQSLGGELLAGILEDVLGFGGESDHNLRLLAQRNFFKDVGSRFQFERERTFPFYFLRRG